jgi:hypothetical protein
MRCENHARFARIYARRRNVGVGDHTSDPCWSPRYFSCDSVARGAKFLVVYLQYPTNNEMTRSHGEETAGFHHLKGMSLSFCEAYGGPCAGMTVKDSDTFELHAGMDTGSLNEHSDTSE